MFLIPCGNHAQFVGGSAAERLMSALAYGWVEHCNDVAGCETRLFQDKYFLCVISATVFCLMNCDENIEFFDEYICFRYMLIIYASVYVFKFNAFLCLCLFMGLYFLG